MKLSFDWNKIQVSPICILYQWTCTKKKDCLFASFFHSCILRHLICSFIERRFKALRTVTLPTTSGPSQKTWNVCLRLLYFFDWILWNQGIGNLVERCWETVERLRREWECERSLRDCCETVDRTKTSFNSLQHPQQHSSDITPKILNNSHRITQKHLSDISQTFLNITQTSLKHLSTTFINILQTISDNITLIITNQNQVSPQENLCIIYGSSIDNLRIIYG